MFVLKWVSEGKCKYRKCRFHNHHQLHEMFFHVSQREHYSCYQYGCMVLVSGLKSVMPSALHYTLLCALPYKWYQTCSPQLAPSTMAMQNASVSDVLRKMWPCTKTPRTSLCSKAPSRRTLQCSSWKKLDMQKHFHTQSNLWLFNTVTA